MKNYHNFEKKYIGDSDIASLTVRFPGSAQTLDFGEDGAYSAYIVEDAEVEISPHYTLVASGHSWINIYDDEGKTFEAQADQINIYRAGSFGCIIQLL